MKNRLKKILIIPDCHFPYHDKRSWSLMLKAARGFKPDSILIQGDFADFYSVSSHSKSPDRVNKLHSEVESVNKALDQLDSLGAKQKFFLAGNHEDRLRRYLEDKAPELFGLVEIPELFNLKKRKWHYTPYKSDLKMGKLNATHDVGKAGKTAIISSLGTYQSNIVTGHTHRICMMVEGNAQGKSHVGASFGWLGDSKKVDYMHRVNVARDWAQGFGVAYMEPNGNVHIVPIVIVDGKCVVEGVLYG